ncbi:MAG: potassium/proton antiporter [Pseudomonadota bacterium]|nr:potassium/proton antiporter [Pseudomonadota bacterium]
MTSISVVNTALLLGSALVLAGILSSLVATRFGAPLLLVFLSVGMLAGEDGPGGIPFDDYQVTYLVGSLALAVILFDGGLRTRLDRIQGALAPALLLATVGVVVTAALVGIVASLVLGIPWLYGLLLGVIVASTDSAAVFFLLRVGGLQLRPRVGAVLEIESGTNDPMAVFLTLLLTQILRAGGEGADASALLVLIAHGAIGAVGGALGGLAAALVLNRVELPSGLHPIFVVASAILIYAATSLAHGSGFLAVYIAGLVLGNRPVRAFPAIASFHDAATWFCQIVMFLVLGLLVTPHRLVPIAVPSLLIGLFLIFVARPVAVWLCLAPFGFSRRATLFVSWVGLRGAVSIFLAAIPMLSRIPEAGIFVDVSFFVVLASLIVQGWTVTPVARRLGMAQPTTAPAVNRVELDLPGQLEQELVGYPIGPDSAVLAHTTPSWARPVLVIRDERILSPPEAGALQPGDYAYFLVSPRQVQRLDRLIETAASDRARFVELPVRGDAPVSTLAGLYGLGLAADEQALTVSELFRQRLGEVPQPGDSLDLDRVVLVATSVDDGQVRQALLEIPSGEESEPATRRMRALRLLARAARRLRRLRGG